MWFPQNLKKKSKAKRADNKNMFLFLLSFNMQQTPSKSST